MVCYGIFWSGQQESIHTRTNQNARIERKDFYYRVLSPIIRDGLPTYHLKNFETVTA